MATITKEIIVQADVADVWEVIGDFAAGPSRMAPGYVVDTRADGDTRVVTFADGTVVRERLVAVDPERHRIAYSVQGPAHDNASMQVFADGAGRCRVVWIHDLLPDELAPRFEASMARGMAVMQRALAG